MVRNLHPADHHPVRIRKIYKEFTRELDFEDIKCLVKIRDVYKIKKRTPLALVFLILKVRNNIQSTCRKIVSKDMFVYYL